MMRGTKPDPAKMKKGPPRADLFQAVMARLTGLEPATLGVTGRYSNQLSYNRPLHNRTRLTDISECPVLIWRMPCRVKRLAGADNSFLMSFPIAGNCLALSDHTCGPNHTNTAEQKMAGSDGGS